MADVGISVQLQGLDTVNRGIDTLTAKTKTFGDTAKTSSDKARSAFAGIGNVFGGLQIDRIFEKAKSYIDATITSLEQMGRTSRALGVSSMDLQRWSFAAERMGVESGAVTDSLKFLNKALGEMRLGQVTPGVQILQAMGVSMKAVKDGTLSTADAFKTISQGLQRIPDQATRVRVALELFGRGGEQMLTALNDPAQWNYLLKHFDELGIGVQQNVVDYFADAHSVVKDFGAQLQDLAEKTIAGAIYALDDLGTGVEKLYDQLRHPPKPPDFVPKPSPNFLGGMTGGREFRYAVNSANANALAANSIPQLAMPKFNIASGVASANIKSDPLNLSGILDPSVLKAQEVLKSLKSQYDTLTDSMSGSNYVQIRNQALLRAGVPLESEQGKKIDAWAHSISDLTSEIQDQEEAGKLWEEQIKERAQLIDENKTEAEKYADQLDRITRLLSSDPEQLDRAIGNLNKSMAQADPLAKSLGDSIGSAFEKALGGGGKLKDIFKGLVSDIKTALIHELIGKQISEAITGALHGALGGGSSGNMFGGFLDALKNILSGKGDFLSSLSHILSSAWDSLSSVLGGLLSGLGSVGGGAGNLIAEGIGAIGSLLGFAGGGDLTVTRPQLVMVGERGPERLSVRPMAGGGSGEGHGGGIHVHLPPSSVISNITAGTFARQIGRVVKQENRRRV